MWPTASRPDRTERGCVATPGYATPLSEETSQGIGLAGWGQRTGQPQPALAHMARPASRPVRATTRGLQSVSAPRPGGPRFDPHEKSRRQGKARIRPPPPARQTRPSPARPLLSSSADKGLARVIVRRTASPLALFLPSTCSSATGAVRRNDHGRERKKKTETSISLPPPPLFKLLLPTRRRAGSGRGCE